MQQPDLHQSAGGLLLFVKFLLLALLAMTGNIQTACAQDYRIYTRVSVHEKNVENSQPVYQGRTLTIWHAGKVYDYMDSVGELVIYDPQIERYTILNGPYQMACTVDFSELKHYLKVARTQAKEFMTEIAEADLPGSARSVEKIAFQLDPKFDYELDNNNLQLFCKSPHISYKVQAIEAPNPDVAKAFRNYADWAAQLNFVLHPQAMIPDARLLVNAKLEETSWIPSRVELDLKDNRGTVLTAEHSIQWDLGPTDRARIMEWKKLQDNTKLQFVSFQEYQRLLLAQFSE